jgi:cell division protease FtsH
VATPIPGRQPASTVLVMFRSGPKPEQRRDPSRPEPDEPARSRWLTPTIWLIAVACVIEFWALSTVSSQPARVTIPYAPTFAAQVRAGNVSSVTFVGDAITGSFRREVRYPPDEKDSSFTEFSTRQPPPPGDSALLPLLRAHGVTVTAKAEEGRSPLVAILLAVAPWLLLLAFFVWVTRGAARGATSMFGMGQSRARRYQPVERVTFDDVAGIDEAKAELTQVVDFLKEPERFRKLGARIPRGVLLTGPPGTGKTLLARAVAGEADVPFFSMSASEFIEMLVGVGASRVRDLFNQAKAAAPAIIFIDELDAIGRSRAAAIHLGGGSDEREQTLNQILTEMDGFDTSTGVIVLAATNRPDVLDSALLRAGRFDRRIAVQPPDRPGRLAILRVHTRSIPLGPDADLEKLAAETPGMVGADLASLANEGALLAATRGKTVVTMKDLEDALEKTLLGSERKLVMSRDDRERTAYHESGHALVGMLSDGADPVRKVSIIPRGAALGITYAAPDADRYSYTREELRTKIRIALGGRAAEELVYGDVTTGAESDIEQLTAIARQMVARWGMSDLIGPVSMMPANAHDLLLPGAAEASVESQRLVDVEIHRIIDEAHAEARLLLAEHREQLDHLAGALLDAETLDQSHAYAAAGLTEPVTETERVPAVSH